MASPGAPSSRRDDPRRQAPSGRFSGDRSPADSPIPGSASGWGYGTGGCSPGLWKGHLFTPLGRGNRTALAPSLYEGVRPLVETCLWETQQPGTEQLLSRATRPQRPGVTVACVSSESPLRGSKWKARPRHFGMKYARNGVRTRRGRAQMTDDGNGDGG